MSKEAEKLLRELYEQVPESYDDDSDGCRYCNGNIQIGGARGAIARKPVTPHDEDCIYRRVAEYLS